MQVRVRNLQALFASTYLLLQCFTCLQTDQKLQFDYHDEAYNSLLKPDDPAILSVYFFNWTNPEDIYNAEIKPKFEELGPYVYKAFIEKTNISWNSENETITYKNLVNYEFDEESSSGFTSDIITTIDMVALAIVHSAKDRPYLFKTSIRFALSTIDSKIYIQKTVRELLFEGYEHPLLAFGNLLPFVSENPTNDRFGWFKGRNGTIGTDGIFNVAINADNFGELKKWNYESKTPFYQGECAEIKGSAGELYRKNIKPDHIEIFSTEACRSIELEFAENIDTKGKSGYKYTLGSKVFDNGTLVEKNKCFCKEECPASGVIDVSKCSGGSPVYLSMPHFYLADLSYGNAVEGLHPEKDKHESYITLEEVTNILLESKSRIQVNVLLQPTEDFPLYENISEIMFPVFWYEEKVTASD